MPAALYFCFSFSFPLPGRTCASFFSVLGRIYISEARPRFFAAPLPSSVRSFFLLLSFPGARLFVLSVHSSTSPRSVRRVLSRCLFPVSCRDPDGGTDAGSSERLKQWVPPRAASSRLARRAASAPSCEVCPAWGREVPEETSPPPHCCTGGACSRFRPRDTLYNGQRINENQREAGKKRRGRGARRRTDGSAGEGEGEGGGEWYRVEWRVKF